MNPIINELLDIKRPEFINISGSVVLHKLLINHNISHNWKSSDLDIYISINNNNFTVQKCLNYIKKILKYLTNGTNNQNSFIINTMSDYTYDITDAVAKAYINNMINNSNNNNSDYDSDNDLDINSDYDSDTNSDVHSDIDLDSYILISNNILNIIKFEIDNIKIDFILIDIEIDDYINNNFDLSIIQIYINNNNQIIQLNDINDIKNKISNYNLQLFNRLISKKVMYRQNNIIKFIDRIIKYTDRGFQIYLNYLQCLCNKINCLCTIKLDDDFINTFNQGCVNYYTINNENYSHKNIYKSELLNYVYGNDHIVYITIFNKMILLRDLTINYIYNPKNLLFVFDNIFE